MSEQRIGTVEGVMGAYSQDQARRAVQRMLPGGRVSTTSHLVTGAHVISATSADGQTYAANARNWAGAVESIRRQVLGTEAGR